MSRALTARKLGMDNEYTLNVEASPDCHINTRDEPNGCRMIEGSDDFLKYTEKGFYKLNQRLYTVYCIHFNSRGNENIQRHVKSNAHFQPINCQSVT